MSTSPTGRPDDNVAGEKPGVDLNPASTRGLAVLCSASVAGVYFLQPLLVLVSMSFGVTGASVGLIPMLAQVAVGIGVIFLLPLGDVVDNRRIVIAAITGQAAAMLLMAWSPNFATFLLGIALLGLLTIAPYLIASAASHLTLVRMRGRVTGALTKGIIVGILLARTVGGFVGAYIASRGVTHHEGNLEAATYHQCDAKSQESLHRLFEAIGQVDHVAMTVHESAARLGIDTTADKMNLDAVMAYCNGKFFSQYRVVKAALPHLASGGTRSAARDTGGQRDRWQTTPPFRR